MQRARLYPQLAAGFLLWWDRWRRWTNAPFLPGRDLGRRFPLPEMGCVIKIDRVFTAIDGGGQERAIYPYFSELPQLNGEVAGMGLWLRGQALPEIGLAEIRVLDVIRGRAFAIDRDPLRGDEELRFGQSYARILRLWDEIDASVA